MYNLFIICIISILSQIDFKPKMKLRKSSDRICVEIQDNENISSKVSKCFHVDKNKQTEIESIDSIDNSLTFGLYHVCNLRHQLLECNPIKAGPNYELNFYKLDLRIPHKIAKYRVKLQTSSGEIISHFASGDTHICGLFEKPPKSGSQDRSAILKLYCWGDNSNQQLEFPKEINDKIKLLSMGNLDKVKLVATGNTTCISLSQIDISIGRGTADVKRQYQDFTECWGRIPMKAYKQYDILEIGEYDTLCLGTSIDAIHDLIEPKCYSTIEDNPIILIPDEIRLKCVSMSVGQNHACSKFDDIHSQIGCWGNNDHGQTNVPNSVVYSTSSQVAANLYSCAAKKNGRVICWGKLNETGPNMKQKHIPLHITSQVSAGGTHGCGSYDGELKCQGKDDFNQLAIPSNHQFDSKQVQTGWDFTCSVNMREKVDCWGLNINGQSDVPEKIQMSLMSVISVHSSLNRSCAIQVDIKVNFSAICWGDHDQQGENTVPAEFQGKIMETAVGDFHTCIRLIPQLGANRRFYNTEDIKCFGNNENGQIDVPSLYHQVPKSISAGDEHTCYLYKSTRLLSDFAVAAGNRSSTSLDNIVCWGSDSKGQSTVPTFEFDAYCSLHHLKAGDNHTCVILKVTSESVLRCWGLGQESEDKAVVQMNTLQVALGNDYDCLIDKDWQVSCWGENEFGQCNVPKQELAYSFLRISNQENDRDRYNV